MRLGLRWSARRALGPLAVVAAADAAGAQACRPPDGRSVHYVNAMRTVATHTGAAYADTRAGLRLPAAAASDVAYVTDERVCRRAARAYRAAAGTRADGVAPSGRVYVVRVGAAYVVWDPAFTYGEFTVAMTMDRRFAVLARSAG